MLPTGCHVQKRSEYYLTDWLTIHQCGSRSDGFVADRTPPYIACHGPRKKPCLPTVPLLRPGSRTLPTAAQYPLAKALRTSYVGGRPVACRPHLGGVGILPGYHTCEERVHANRTSHNGGVDAAPGGMCNNRMRHRTIAHASKRALSAAGTDWVAVPRAGFAPPYATAETALSTPGHFRLQECTRANKQAPSVQQAIARLTGQTLLELRIPLTA
eukprot:scaffold6860_cov376-Prasinococcus_capsulatus_cf.AAC.4